MRLYSSFILVLLLILCNATHAAQPSFNSPEKLRDALLTTRTSQDIEAAMKLFCPAKTGKWVVDMYRGSVESVLTLPLISATVETIPSEGRPTITHSVEPVGRVVFVFDTSKQKGVTIGESFLYFGRVGQGYCFALPIAPDRP